MRTPGGGKSGHRDLTGKMRGETSPYLFDFTGCAQDPKALGRLRSKDGWAGRKWANSEETRGRVASRGKDATRSYLRFAPGRGSARPSLPDGQCKLSTGWLEPITLKCQDFSHNRRRMFAHGQADLPMRTLPWETWTLCKSQMVRRRPRVLGEGTRSAFVRRSARLDLIGFYRSETVESLKNIFSTFGPAR